MVLKAVGPIPLILACLQKATGLALPLNVLTALASLTHNEMPRAELSLCCLPHTYPAVLPAGLPFHEDLDCAQAASCVAEACPAPAQPPELPGPLDPHERAFPGDSGPSCPFLDLNAGPGAGR